MRLKAGELQGQLQRGLLPVYLISGDEPLQLGEAADAIRTSAAARGFTTRELLEAGKGFDWNRLAAEAGSLSLFAEKKIIDLRMPLGTPGKEGGEALADYCATPPPDTLLLLTLPKLDRKQLGAKWLKVVESVGVLVQVWPIEGRQLVPWVKRRLLAAGLEPAPGVAELLASRVEGNLLAASQEVEKLLLLHGPGQISAAQLVAAVADSTRFDVFELVDSAMRAEAERCVRILAGLQGEGLAPAVVLWALTRELRTLLMLARDIADGATPAEAMSRARVWDKRKAVLAAGLRRLDVDDLSELLRRGQIIDGVIKGVRKDDPWRWLEQTTLALAGVRPIATVV